MGSIRFIYDEDDFKEIKVVCVKEDGEELGEEAKKDMLETIKIFCLNSIPDTLKHEITEDEDGFKVVCEDSEIGEQVLTHIFKMTYLVTRAAIVFKEEFTRGELSVDSLDLGKLRPDIEKTEELGYQELAKLIGEVDDVG